MPAIPTREVVRLSDGTACTINECDFDADLYAAPDAKKKKPVGKSRKTATATSTPAVVDRIG